MSRLYGPVHRSLQDRFDTRRLADNVETRVRGPAAPESATFTAFLAYAPWATLARSINAANS